MFGGRPQVKLGVLTEEEAEECISMEFNPVRWVCKVSVGREGGDEGPETKPGAC